MSAEASICVESGVSAKTGNPFVHLNWGPHKAQFTPAEMREHAMGLLQAAAAAEMDACLVKWAGEKLQVDQQRQHALLGLFREKRMKGELPSMSINVDGDRMTPEELKQASYSMLQMAFWTEMEAFLCDVVVKDVGLPIEAADQMIQELRDMMGAKTMWPSEQS